MFATLLWTSKGFRKICGLSILLHGFVSLPDATSYDKIIKHEIIFVFVGMLQVSKAQDFGDFQIFP